jgi:hypothetical protein
MDTTTTTPTLSEALAVVRAAVAHLHDGHRLAGSGQRDLLESVAGVEAIGRVTDAARTVLAGEVEHRSRATLGSDGPAATLGCGSGSELLQRIARINPTSARARIRLGTQIHRAISFSGALEPAGFPAVRAGLACGRLGIDSATIITGALGKVLTGTAPGDRDRLAPQVQGAEHELVAAAIGASPAPGVDGLAPVTPVETQIQADTWLAYLNPDGAPPAEAVFPARALRMHRAKDGLIPISGLLTPEVAGQMRRVFDTLINPRQSLSFLTEEERAELDASGARDRRTIDQRQHDALATVFEVAGRCGQLPTLGGASATMVVSVAAEDHTAGHGVGHVDGLNAPISMAAVRQLCCANGIQPLHLSRTGRILRIGTTERAFNRAQRRALTVRDGGCIIPGCPIPAWACEAHHVLPYEVDPRTHTDNGVLLCWYHHRTIETSGWHIRMIDGTPEVMPPRELGTQVWTPTTKSPTRLGREHRDRHGPPG